MVLTPVDCRDGAPRAFARWRVVASAHLCVLGVILAALPARAERVATRDALDRMEETLELAFDEETLRREQLLPAIVVSVEPLYEDSLRSYSTSALAILVRVLGAEGLRLCEACTRPRTLVGSGRLEHSVGVIGAAEIKRLDERLRGAAAPARVAIWLDESANGVSLRMVDLATSRIVFAQSFDPELTAMKRSTRSFTHTQELARRARGDSLSHAFVDFGMYPGQHFSLEWTDQWGDTNANLSGFVISLFDPVVGVGGAYYRVIPEAFNLAIGGKVMMSIPTALSSALGGEDVELIDRLLTAVVAARVPFGASSNYGGFAFLSTNGRVGVGICLLNTSILPVLP